MTQQELKEKLAKLGKERVEARDTYDATMKHLYEEERKTIEELNART